MIGEITRSSGHSAEKLMEMKDRLERLKEGVEASTDRRQRYSPSVIRASSRAPDVSTERGAISQQVESVFRRASIIEIGPAAAAKMERAEGATGVGLA